MRGLGDGWYGGVWWRIVQNEKIEHGLHQCMLLDPKFPTTQQYIRREIDHSGDDTPEHTYMS